MNFGNTPKAIVDNVTYLTDRLYAQEMQKEREKLLFADKEPFYKYMRENVPRFYDPKKKFTAQCAKIIEQLDQLTNRVSSVTVCLQIAALIEDLPNHLKIAIRNNILDKIEEARDKPILYSPDSLNSKLWQKFHARMLDEKRELLADLDQAYGQESYIKQFKANAFYKQIRKIIAEFEIKSEDSLSAATIFSRQYLALEQAINDAVTLHKDKISPAFLKAIQTNGLNGLLAKIGVYREYVGRVEKELQTQVVVDDQKGSNKESQGVRGEVKQGDVPDNAAATTTPKEFEEKQRGLLLKKAEELAKKEIAAEIPFSKFSEICTLQQRLMVAKKTLVAAETKAAEQKQPKPFDYIILCRRLRGDYGDRVVLKPRSLIMIMN